MKRVILLVVMSSVMAAMAVNIPMLPFTFVGRITNADNMAYGNELKAVVTAYLSSGDAEKPMLARVDTFTKAYTKYNYRLPIQITDTRLDGYALVNDTVVITVADPYGKIWAGIVADQQITQSGGLKELNMVLSEKRSYPYSDGGTEKSVEVDRELYDYLEFLWEDSDYYSRGAKFNVMADYDGDGVSTLAEAYAGTDPFNADDHLKIVDYKVSKKENHDLVFKTKPGRVYVIESTDDLKGEWKEVDFALEKNGAKTREISIDSRDYDDTKTVYLFPVESPKRFYRVRLLK